MYNRFNIGINGVEEAGEGIVAGRAELALLVDIVLVVLLANFFDSEDNINDRHLSVIRFLLL